MRLGHVRGRRHVALAKERQHLRGGDLGDLEHEVVLARGPIGLGQDGGRAGGISPGKCQAGEQHLPGDGSVGVRYLSCQPDALLPVLSGGVEVVPLVVHTGQAQVGFADERKRQTACQLNRVPERLDRQTELVVQFLDEAQADRPQDLVECVFPDAALIAVTSVRACRAPARSPRST